MAKKKFNIGNLSASSSPTPSSREKSKLTDDAVAKIHGTESTAPAKKMGRPRREEAVTRLTVDLPKPIHKKLKMRATEDEISLRQLVIDILMREVEK
ncbi:MAG: hypothetical protein AB8H03_26795 [Saprospiraceae bacterium]